jgi:hypothetical protein
MKVMMEMKRKGREEDEEKCVGGSLFDTINLQDPMVSFLTKKLNG